ncbi:hypothetical protein CLV51_10217 [Chitinophaga niastensis]|uniref:Uncharacterized protein n=1 Tax=Chitinophaga niastensis TaxID=536980 RepID=A0A2P8HLS8_CHINA|nr:hypothetical protein [Chitinophaga niastensis]PSL47172.1 hypothetical protein CLV51_10217 [Chitinophaga niastensis]
MEIQDKKLATAIEAIWDAAEVLFEKKDLARYVLKLEEAWDLLPLPKELYDDSYHIASFIAETYLELKDFPYALKWARTLQHCDPERADDGGREFILGKVLFDSKEMSEAEVQLSIAMHKSAGRVFEGADEKYLHAFKGIASVVEEELPDSIYEQIEQLSEAGNDLADADNYDGAIAKFTEALELIPAPKNNWEASTWLYASIGDMQFLKDDFKAAADNFFDALNGPDAQTVGFIHLRLGECLLELKQEDKSLDHLLRAYMLEGAEIFAAEDSKYFDFLRERVEL